jgi:PIN domain nuclease of toxin-antitoxin system
VTVLLDTQVWLWMLAAPERLSKKGRSLVASTDTQLVLSAASAWEIAIKHGLGKLHLPEPPLAYVSRLLLETSVNSLSVDHRHALHVATLPPHHRDPFDRMLIAQSQLEDLPILTVDPVFRRYDIEVIAA